MKKMILFRVNAGDQYGAGHLERCLVLARQLRKKYDPYFLAKGDNQIGEILYKENFNFKLALHGFDQEIKDISGLQPNLVFIDMMETPISYVRAVKEFAPVITLDDRGSGSEAACLTVYSLPLEKPRMANLSSSEYLIFRPEIEEHDKRDYQKKARRILVSFGGSDPANLSSVFIRIAKLSDPKLEWVFIRGQFNRHRWAEGNYTTLQAGDQLFSEIAQADVVITSFGMTAWESAAIGTPVLLCNPAEYHERLSEIAGIFGRLGVYRPESKKSPDNTNELARAFASQIKDYEMLVQQAIAAKTRVDKSGAQRVVALIESLLEADRHEACQVCGKRRERALVRNERINIFACENCGLFWKHWFELPVFDYEKPYFFEEYNEQYGKTYPEDRENIDRLGLARLEILNKLYQGQAKKYSLREKNLLDVGAAFGFFLDLAREHGEWAVKGIEKSKTASKSARERLILEIETAGFLEAEVEKEHYQAITLWYVIEHLPKLNEVIEKIYTSLTRGGMIAFATPNNRGFQGRFRREAYLAKHPEDHYFDFSIKTMRLLLKRYRFKVLKVRSTGIHFDRFLAGREGGFWDKKFFARCYQIIAKILKLGDTFEIYAVKK